MTLSEFKFIFFWEYIHRMLGRLIGLFAVLPFIYFIIKKQLPNGFKKQWLGIIILIGCQGLMGWYMVKSGLVDNPHVSHFRLAAHLSLAFLIFILILHQYLKALYPTGNIKRTRLSNLSLGLLVLIGLQIVYGAFTAGLDAGHFYNTTYPKMGSEWLPAAALMYDGGWLGNALNNPIMVQWVHRWLAVAVVIGGLLVWRDCIKQPKLTIQYAGLAVLGAIGFQFILGIITLLTGVWLPVALAHQFGALVLLSTTATLHFFTTRDHIS